MPDLSAVVSAIPSEEWWWFAAGFAFFLGVGAFPHIRQAWHEWRLARRLRNDGYMLREEQREYHLAIGEEQEPFEAGRWLTGALGAAALMVAPFVFDALDAKDLWDEATFVFGGAAILFSLWKWLNNPPAEDEGQARPETEIPQEAIYGMIGGLSLAALVIVAAIFVF